MRRTDRGLSARRSRELRLLVLGVVFVLVVTPRVSVTMDAAWQAEGLGRAVAGGAVGVLPLVNDAIAFPLGVFGAWLVLFGLDRSKRLQTPLVLLAAVAFAIVAIFVRDNWLAVLALGTDWPALILGAGFGLVTGAAPQVASRRRSREFPGAARGLFVTVLLLGIVALLDLYLFGTPEPTGGGILPSPGTAVGALVDVFAVSVFVATTGLLVLYTDRREIVVVDGGNGTATVLAALYDATDPDHAGRVTAGDGTALLEARGALEDGVRPNPIGGRVELSFLPPHRFPRWVTVGTEQYDPATLDPDELESADDSSGVFDFFGRVVPRRLHRLVKPDAVRWTTKLQRADVVLFVVSMDDFDSVNGFGDIDDLQDVSEPRELDDCRALSRNLPVRVDQMAVLVGAERALRLYESLSGVAEASIDDEASFQSWVREDLLGLRRATVVPLSNELAGDDHLVANVTELRRQIEA